MKKLLFMFSIFLSFFMINNIAQADGCIEETLSNNWIVGTNCIVPWPAKSATVINEIKSGYGPSPYIIKTENADGKTNEIYSRVRCLGDRETDTRGSTWTSYCHEPRVEFEKGIAFENITNKSFKATWERDDEVNMHYLRLYNKRTNTSILSTKTTADNFYDFKYLNLEQGETYKLTITAKNGTTVFGRFIDEFTLPYSLSNRFSRIDPSYKSIGLRWKKLYGADKYKLEIFKGNNKIVSNDYESPSNTDYDCTVLNNKSTYCSMSYDGLDYSTEYRAVVTAYNGTTKLTTFEGDFITLNEVKKITFGDIGSDGFTFYWPKTEGISYYQYTISKPRKYDANSQKWLEKEDIVIGKLDLNSDGSKESYNTKTGKYKDFDGFPLEVNTKYDVLVQGYSNAKKRFIINAYGQTLTDGDDITVISKNTKKLLDDLVIKIGGAYLSNESKYLSLIGILKSSIDEADEESIEGKKIILKASYLKNKLEKIVEQKSYITLKSHSSVKINDITNNSFSVVIPKFKTDRKTVLFKVISQYTSPYRMNSFRNINNGEYIYSTTEYSNITGNDFEVFSCTKYTITLKYLSPGGKYYTPVEASMVTPGCEELENLVIDIIKGNLTELNNKIESNNQTETNQATQKTLSSSMQTRIDSIVIRFYNKIIEKYSTTTKRLSIIKIITGKLELLGDQQPEFKYIIDYLIDGINSKDY